MTDAQSISDHWGTGDVYARIIEAMEAASISPDTVTVEQMAPVDHFHARGFPATIELGDTLPIQAGHHIVDIGCGIGGPARYLAERFGCRVSGVDITEPFAEAAKKLTAPLENGWTSRGRMGRRASPALRRCNVRWRVHAARDHERHRSRPLFRRSVPRPETRCFLCANRTRSWA